MTWSNEKKLRDVMEEAVNFFTRHARLTTEGQVREVLQRDMILDRMKNAVAQHDRTTLAHRR